MDFPSSIQRLASPRLALSRSIIHQTVGRRPGVLLGTARSGLYGMRVTDDSGQCPDGPEDWRRYGSTKARR